MTWTSALRLVVRLLATAGVVVAIVAAVMLWPASTAGPCVVEHHTTIAELPEASGLAISRRTPGIVWSHNDSGHETVLFAIDTSGALRGRVRVPVRTRDWEDVSAARCPAGDCLYIADIGDNRLARTQVRIYRVPEPAPGDAETVKPEVFTAAYADGPHNAEAMFVVGDDVFVVAREKLGPLYRGALPRSGGGDVRLERIGELGLAPVTDAEASPDEASVAVRTSKVVVIYRTGDVVRGGAVQAGLRIPIEELREPQGEGIALDGRGMLLLASEGRPWNRAGRFIGLRCTH